MYLKPRIDNLKVLIYYIFKSRDKLLKYGWSSFWHICKIVALVTSFTFWYWKFDNTIIGIFQKSYSWRVHYLTNLNRFTWCNSSIHCSLNVECTIKLVIFLLCRYFRSLAKNICKVLGLFIYLVGDCSKYS